MNAFSTFNAISHTPLMLKLGKQLKWKWTFLLLNTGRQFIINIISIDLVLASVSPFSRKQMINLPYTEVGEVIPLFKNC